MIKKILLNIVALCAMGAAAATVVVAAAFALYALVEPTLGRAGAAGVTALAFAVIMALIGFLLSRQAKGGAARRKPEPSVAERLTEMARERPILAGGAALAAGLIALKNPQIIASLVSAALAAKTGDKAVRKRR